MTHHTNTNRLVASSRETTTAGEGVSPALPPALHPGSHHDEDVAVVGVAWPAVRHGDKSTAPSFPDPHLSAGNDGCPSIPSLDAAGAKSESGCKADRGRGPHAGGISSSKSRQAVAYSPFTARHVEPWRAV